MIDRGPSVAEIKALLDQRRLELLRMLGITARPNARGSLLISAPRRKDRNPSFGIWTHGGTLSFKDMATSEGGDALNLIDYMQGFPRAQRGCSLEAIQWAKDFLGIERMDAAARKALAAKATAIAKQAQKQSEEDLDRNRRLAYRAFVGAEILRPGMLPWRYLRDARGIDLDALPRGPRGGDRTPAALRYEPEHLHRESGLKLPTLIACCVDPVEFRIRAVHRTYLDAERAAKAPVIPPRKCWPAYAGCIIPLWRGASGLSVLEANRYGVRETWQGGEGIEKSLAMALAAPEYRTFAFISLSNLGNIKLPASCDGLIIHRDNEWDNGAARDAFNKGRHAIEAQGRPVTEVRAAYGKDFDDGLREDLESAAA